MKAMGALVSASELQEWVGRATVRVLDVRTPAEFEASHIAGSYNVPLDTLGEHAPELTARVQEEVVLVCRSGGRARQAESALRESGMARLHVLEGGMSAWEAAGLDVVRGASSRWPLERQVRLAAGVLVLAGVLGGALLTPWLYAVAGFVGAGLTFAGLTDWCGMARLLGRLPYNRRSSCDVGEMVAALKRGAASPAAAQAGR
jgi:rhodanese-related sulfurtransferase